MNYDQTIQQVIKLIKEDKSIIQPWRNKAVARLEETQAFIKMGKTSTYEKEEPVCTCPPVGGIRRTCPVHGSAV